MLVNPRFIVDVYETTPAGHIGHGVVDITYPALEHMADGLPFGLGDQLPSTHDIAKQLTHEARMALWSNRLLSADLSEKYRSYSEEVAAWGGHAVITPKLKAIEGAEEMVSFAQKLRLDVERGIPILAGKAVHPISGRLMDASKIHSEIPFGFASIPSRFHGINPTSLEEFIIDGEGCAEDLLGTILSSPAKWFKDIAHLDVIIQEYREKLDFQKLKMGLIRWNPKQDVTLHIPDRSHIVLPENGSKDKALDWCDLNLSIAQEILNAVSLTPNNYSLSY